VLARLKKYKWRLAVALLLAVNFGLVSFALQRPDGLAHIYFLDVGQGDAILITTPNDQHILIDGGPTGAVVSKLDGILPVWDRDIDYMLLTHPHADHATGLLAVLQRYSVKHFLYNGVDYDTEIYTTLLEEVNRQRIPVEIAEVSDDLKFGETSLDIIAPAVERPKRADPNETSVVAVFRYKNFRAIFTGDASINNERELLAAGLVPDVDVLKVGHQGSHTSSSIEFLQAARPEVGVIEVGPNTYGHPHRDILQRLTALGVAIYRTDQNGTIEVATDGAKYRVL